MSLLITANIEAKCHCTGLERAAEYTHNYVWCRFFATGFQATQMHGKLNDKRCLTGKPWHIDGAHTLGGVRLPQRVSFRLSGGGPSQVAMGTVTQTGHHPVKAQEIGGGLCQDMDFGGITPAGWVRETRSKTTGIPRFARRSSTSSAIPSEKYS